MENTSGGGSKATVPGEIDKWNWGAFLFGWIWGIPNRSLLSLLTLIPFVGVIMMFVLGAKGSAWAWRKKKWDSIEHFKKIQRRWAIAGAIVYGGMFVIATGMVIYEEWRYSDLYKEAVQKVEADDRITMLIGRPIEIGSRHSLYSADTADSTKISGANGFSFTMKGPVSEAVIYVSVDEKSDGWKIIRMVLRREGSEGPEALEIFNESEVEKSAQKLQL